MKSLIFISFFAFAATTVPNRYRVDCYELNKNYTFSFSKSELISRLNMIQLNEIDRLQKNHGDIDFDQESNIFHTRGFNDTLAVMMDPESLEVNDTIKPTYTLPWTFKIFGNQDTSGILLLSYCQGYFGLSAKDYTKKAIRYFESAVIRKINKYR